MIRDKIASILENDSNVLFAYLFGSHARGDARENSDVDLAVFLKEDSLDPQLELHHRLQRALKGEVDLLVLNRVKNLILLESLFREGEVVKDDEERLLFEVKKEHEILDFKAFRRSIDAA
jgi:predicted nucleotidyltransferase